MEKLYHFLGKKRFFLSFLIFAGLLVFFFSPLLGYLPTAVSVGRDFVFGKKEIVRSESDRTNILLLGLDGGRSDPRSRSDTIIFFSIDHTNKDSLLLSLPRDIWIPEIRAKLNTAYHYGNQVDGLGIEWARRYILQITGQPIHYVVVVSFDGFTKAVDLLGGIDVEVEHSFIDRRYPIPGKEDDPCGGDLETLCRYETVSFNQGRQHFDGQTALKFARSRNAEGEEGTDFARSARQQKVILVLKDEVLSPIFLVNPPKVKQMIDFITGSLETDIPQSHLGQFAHLLLNLKKGEIRTEVISEGNKGTPGFLINPPISDEHDKQWVLVPRTGSWEETQKWVVCLLTKGDCPIKETPISR